MSRVYGAITICLLCSQSNSEAFCGWNDGFYVFGAAPESSMISPPSIGVFNYEIPSSPSGLLTRFFLNVRLLVSGALFDCYF